MIKPEEAMHLDLKFQAVKFVIYATVISIWVAGAAGAVGAV